jgi:hypothetical protein
MGYFKEVMMDNEEDFHYLISKDGIVANGKYYTNGELLESEMPEVYFELLTEYVNEVLYG